MTDREERRAHRVELATTILLAVAAVATAWSTYQSSQWRGEQAIDYSMATAARIESSEASTRAGQQTQVDIGLFVQWIDADASGDAKLARFYERRFRTEFRPAFAAWLATRPKTNPKSPLTPFAMPQYRLAEATESTRLNTDAGVRANAAEVANERSNDYVLAVVLFATSLFFAGISTKLHALRQREALVAIGWIIFLATAVWIATSPVRFSG
jgi:hypothetical protein